MSSEANKRQFLEQVEACRPGSDDLRADDFAAAAELVDCDSASHDYYWRVQQSDSRMAIAFHDVTVPEGLADRLLAAVDAAAPIAAAPIAAGPIAEVPAAATSSETAVELREHGNLRRSVVRLAIAASLLAVVGGGLALVSSFTPYSNQQCLADARQAGAKLQPDRWNNPRVAPESHQPKTRLFGTVKGWQPTSLLGDDQAVAYRFANGATLIVGRPSKTVAGLPSAPPAMPQQRAQQSAGTHIGMWTSGGLVHVLMVTGPIEDYRRMTGTTRPVVAQARPQSLPNRHHS